MELCKDRTSDDITSGVTSFTMENNYYLIGITSLYKSFFFNCHVSFRGYTRNAEKPSPKYGMSSTHLLRGLFSGREQLKQFWLRVHVTCSGQVIFLLDEMPPEKWIGIDILNENIQ